MLGDGLKRFWRDESGAYSIEWVAIMGAAIVLTILATYSLIGDGDDGISGLTKLRKQTSEQSSVDIDQLLTLVPSGGGS